MSTKVSPQDAADVVVAWEGEHDLFELLSVAQAASLVAARYGVSTASARATIDGADGALRRFTPYSYSRLFVFSNPPRDAVLPPLWVDGRATKQGTKPYKLVFQAPDTFGLGGLRFVLTYAHEEALVAELVRREEERRAQVRRKSAETAAKREAEDAIKSAVERTAFDARRPELAALLRALEEAVPGAEIRASADPFLPEPGVFLEAVSIAVNWKTIDAFEKWLLSLAHPAKESGPDTPVAVES